MVLVFGSLLHWHWKAALISNLSIEVPKVPFQNMDELISSSYQITLRKDSSWEAAFKNAIDGPFKDAWETKFVDKDLSLQSGFSEMMSLVMTGEYAMYNYLSSVRTLEEFKDCKITDAGFSLKKIYVAFAVQKNSPYREPLNRALTKMLENGEAERIKNKHLGKVPECAENGKGKPMGLASVVFPIGICFLGMCGSVLLLLWELVVSHIYEHVMLR